MSSRKGNDQLRQTLKIKSVRVPCRDLICATFSFLTFSEFVAANDFIEVKFADDLICDKVFPLSAPDAVIFSELAAQQVNIHQWGAASRVEFDPEKEKIKIIHSQLGVGSGFNFLGVMADCKLTMDLECERIVRKVRPKTKANLRIRFFNSTRALILQFKSHVWPLLEGTIGAV